MTSEATTTPTWPRGSEWRKWDLHVHSPASEGFKGDYNQFIIQLGNADCEVIGINDYFSVAGYKEVLARLADPTGTEGNKAYREALEKLKAKTLLPVVECRMTNVLIGKNSKSGSRINFHIVFDPRVWVDDIETLIKGFDIKGQSIGSRYADKHFLRDDCSVDFNVVRKKLTDDATFKDKFLLWIPYNEYGGIDNINPHTDKLFKEGLVSAADILGSSNQEQADFFLWKDPKFPEDVCKTWFGKRKPCIKGSDSHDVNDEVGRLKDHESKPIDKYCWIKADPTFGGLRQITNEPEARVYIGALPPKLQDIKEHPTRYLTGATIRRIHGNDLAHKWFDIEIPLNGDMVAVIGNKGSGKSALADILALAANTQCDPRHFSFLTKERFCERNGRIAKDFEVTLSWEDGSSVKRTLNLKPNPNEVERVKYIPQSYLETVCTETEPGQESEFQTELRKVIFSHITDADRLGQQTLDDLIAYRTEEVRQQLRVHRAEVARLNSEIVRLENRSTPEYIAQLESQRSLKNKELEAHLASKPAAVEQPGTLPPEQQAVVQAVSDDLAKERETLKGLEAQVVAQRGRQKTLTEHIALAKKLEGKLSNFETEYQRLRQEVATDLKSLSLDVDALLTVSVNRVPLVQAREAMTTEKALVDATLAEEGDTSLPRQVAECRTRIKNLQERLDAPNRRHQQYLEALKVWEQRKTDIEGASDVPDTLKYLEGQLAYTKDILPAECDALRTERTAVARTIHGDIATIRDIYAELFLSVQQLIEDSVIIREGFKLTFESSIVDHTFERDFFDRFINHSIAGSFYNKDKGAVRLEEIRADYDFNGENDTIAFVERILANLTQDHRSSGVVRTVLAEQLKKGATSKDLYDFLWSLEYLEPEYSLRLDGKELGHLSPGERGTLLLVFYLLVDKSRNPIIVDQPEENLDNHTVYKLLIPVIKDVKKRRQVVMVTHSPNIAVVCDAEQIIHAYIDRADGNAVQYTLGAIEAPHLNLHVVNVLEGTRPAFDNRGSKYLPQ